MITYFVLTAIANILINYYLLNIVEDSRATDVVNRRGVFYSYVISALAGCVIVPLIMFTVFCALITRK